MFPQKPLSRTWTFFKGDWHEGNLPIMGVRDHATWLCSVVFDGARAFDGVTPDLDLHCARVNDSAVKLFLKPLVTVDEWMSLIRDGIKRFEGDTPLYIRPMYWAEREGPWVQAHDPDSTTWCLVMYEAPMRQPKGFSVTLSPFRRPTIENMPVDAKAGCLYPNNARALFEAQARGFDNAIVCDMLGNVAELATSNIFMARDGCVFTPIPNGTFLAGITRRRVVALLRSAGVTVTESVLTLRDFESADEIFSTGNYSKVVPVARIGDRALAAGPLYSKARELYWDFAHSRVRRFDLPAGAPATAECEDAKK
ncbi:MAG: branched-chain amino acid aminotransferase [Terriglobia bacterium]